MERSIQHQIDTAAGKIFQNAIPNEWVIRDQQQSDYGIDYEIEVFKNNQSTGIIFKIQLKGTEDLKILKDGQTISHSFSLGNIKYYLEEVQIPIFILIGDTIKKIIYWHNPQIDVELRQEYDSLKSSAQESMTVHLNVGNRLPEDLQKILYEYTKSMYFISARYLVQEDDYAFSQIIPILKPDINSINEFQNKVDLLKINQILSLIQKGDFDPAKKLIASVITSNESTIQTKFQAILFSESIDITIAFQNGEEKHKIYKIHMEYAHILKRISKDAPDQLRIYALANLLSFEMHTLAHDEFTLFMNWKLNKDDNDILWLNTVYEERVKYVKKIQIKYSQLKRILNIALEKELYVIIPEIIIKISQPLSIYLQRMRQENIDNAVVLLHEELFGIGHLGVSICKAFNNKKELAGLIYNLLLLSDVSDTADFDKNEKTLFELISDIDDETKEYVKKEISTLRNSALSHSKEKDVIEEEIEIYNNMARALGIDLDNDKDEIATVVKIGIKDLNPGRVLKNCEHLFVMLKHGGMISKWMKLPTAAFKEIICTKHRYRWEGMSLDRLYRTFEMEHCSKCLDKKAHPDDWNWSREWQLEQNEKHKGYK